MSTAGHSFMTNVSSGTMSWDAVLRFVLVVSVWYLQHSFIALTLLEEFDVSPKELHAIRAMCVFCLSVCLLSNLSIFENVIHCPIITNEDANFNRWEKYDADLSGDVSGADIPILLQVWRIAFCIFFYLLFGNLHCCVGHGRAVHSRRDRAHYESCRYRSVGDR